MGDFSATELQRLLNQRRLRLPPNAIVYGFSATSGRNFILNDDMKEQIAAKFDFMVRQGHPRVWFLHLDRKGRGPKDGLHKEDRASVVHVYDVDAATPLDKSRLAPSKHPLGFLVPREAISQQLLDGLDDGAKDDASSSVPASSSKGVLVGKPYVRVGTLAGSARRDPFEIDPDKVDRGNQAHADTQDALAEFLRQQHVEPLSPTKGDPDFDIAWRIEGVVFVAEVKSITTENEEKQLRLGLGQVLRYRHQLSKAGQQATGVLVAEREPSDASWVETCADSGVSLTWPGFDGLLPVHVGEPAEPSSPVDTSSGIVSA